ncbi:RNA polymerase sigma factor [Sphaerisporangium sp. NPDC051011]|uniref:RNA polymerase sigma factor n=1 Tax=Sphaerisporangium sp. NPDC051011 TaxID=3155792 RepID=UPI0033CEF217
MGDEAERFTMLFRRHHRHVLAYVLRRADEAQAEDVVAETFTAAWRHIDRLPEDPLPWLYRTAHNCLSNNRRSARRRERLVDRLTGHHQVVPDHASSVVEEVRLRKALWRLSPGEREALMLISWEGLDHRTAAYVAGCSVSAFKVRLHRARKRLAGLLANDHTPVGEAIR